MRDPAVKSDGPASPGACPAVPWYRTGTPLMVVCMLALAVRVIGLANDLPGYGHMDELYVVQPAYDLGSLELGTPNLQHPGSLQNFITAGAFGIYFGLARLAGVFSSVQDFKALYWINPTGFYVAARLVVVAFAVLTVWLVYRLGLRLSDKRTGLVAALVLAALPLHVALSRVVMKDVPLAFAVVAVLLCCESIVARGRRRDYAIAGILLGCGLAVKYSAAILVVPIVVAHWVRLSRTGHFRTGTAWRALAGPGLLLAAGTTIAAFMVACPYTVTATRHWWNELMFQFGHQSKGHFGYEPTGVGWWFYLSRKLAPGVTWPVLLAALGGVMLDLRRRGRDGLAMLSFLLAYWAILGASNVSFDRYCLPHLPLVSIYAAVFVVSAATVLAERTRHRHAQTAIVTCLGVAVLGMLSWHTGRQVLGYSRLDSRIQADRWIRMYAPPGARWVADGQGPTIGDPAIEIRTGLAPPYDDILDAAARKGVRFAVVSEYTRRVLTDPRSVERYPTLCREYLRLIHWLDSQARVLKVFPGRTALGRGPRITIYLVDPDRLRANRRTERDSAATQPG